VLESPYAGTSDPQRSLLVGCGHNARPGWVNLDLAPLPGVDVVHDLDAGPLPFPDGHFELVECVNVLEHVEDLPAVMSEIHRVLEPGGVLYVTAPHFTSVTWPTDPTHRRALAINTLEFFSEASFLDRAYYYDFSFREVRRRRIRLQRSVLMPWNYLLEPLINCHPKVQTYYEATGWSRLFPAHYVEAELVR
jgi:SAM-dependent methyltransferase